MGDPAYETNADFNPDKKREVISLGSALPLWRGIILDLSLRSLNTSKLDFKENSFIDFTMALRYNIPY